MDQRKAHLEFFDTYQKIILDNLEKFKELKGISLEKISESELPEIKARLKALFNNLDLMIIKEWIVSNSKVLHFFLPDLMMPIDNNTLNYLKQKDSVEGFLNIFEFMWKVANQIDLSKFVDKKKWNSTIPKVIDNIILSLERERGRKKYYNKKLKEFKKNILAGKENKEKCRKGENKYQAIPPDILKEIIEDIREEGNHYFEVNIKEIAE